MAKLSKRINAFRDKVELGKYYSIQDAVNLLKEISSVKFDESVEVAINLGVDPKHADQIVRGTVSLPNGIGKDIRILVFATDDLAEEAEKAGADYVGASDMVEKVSSGATSALGSIEMTGFSSDNLSSMISQVTLS